MTGTGPAPRIGVLAVQGDFEAHRATLARLGIEAPEVRTPADLEGLEGLILPGGESGAHLRILRENGLYEAIPRFHERGGVLFGTCAGLILLAREVEGPAQDSLGLIDVTVRRNAWGRQIDSFETDAAAAPIVNGSGEPLRMVFIRAPRIERTGPGVRVLASHDGEPVLVTEGRVLAATFHPEMTDDVRVHRYFTDMAGRRDAGAEGTTERTAPKI